MTRQKNMCTSGTLVLVLLALCPLVYSRPQQDTSAVVSSNENVQTNLTRDGKFEEMKRSEAAVAPSDISSNARNVKNNVPIIGDSIKKVTGQLLDKPSNETIENPVVIDTRVPPKRKNQLKHRIKTRDESGKEPIENSHAGIAVPVTMEELESENIVTDPSSESSTSNEGISTWVLLSNPLSKDNSTTTTTEATKVEEQQKKQKPTKNKTKRPQANKVPIPKRPMIVSTNKSDLVAGGSAINENVLNKIKDTVLSNVQKNKNTAQRTTTTTTPEPFTEVTISKKEVVTKSTPSHIAAVKVTSKPSKKKIKNKQKVSTVSSTVSESALLPMEGKEQEIEIEVSTPVTTTKKPKRSSTRKKNKTKKRKNSKPKQESTTAISTELKTNKTKSAKQPKPTDTGPISTQIYNYFSREVMPTVGVGVIGLASLVGIASYFLYPFATPVRRTFEVDKKDDIYKHNAEEYGNEGNGQAEEEMLGTVLAGMPVHAKHKLNPYAAQTPQLNRYTVKKDQDIRYRHVQSASNYEPHYKVHYAQQKTGIAHGAVYPEPMNYNRQQYETRHAYTKLTENKYDKGTTYTPYPAVEPIYAAPQTGPTGISSYGADHSNSVIYGVKPSAESDFKPVYPFDGQFYSETTKNPVTYAPTSMYLGSNNEAEESEDTFVDNTDPNSGIVDNKFVVGNVPKELTETVTPAVVPEHGPRNLSKRKKREIRQKKSIAGSIEEILKENKDVFLSNELDEGIRDPISGNGVFELLELNNEKLKTSQVFPIYAVPMDSQKDFTTTELPMSTIKIEIVENISTIPINDNKQETSVTDTSNELDVTTKSYRVYEVFDTNSPSEVTSKTSTLINKNEPKTETTTQFRNIATETTTELKSETTSTMPPSPASITEPKVPLTSTIKPKPTNSPEVITYPPLNQENGFIGFLKRLVEFKYRLGLSILQTTSDSLNRYLRSMEDTIQKVTKASHQ